MMGSDVRYAWRSIWKSRATSLGAMLVMAIGFGATATIFGLVNAVLLRPLPYPESDRLVEIWGNVQRDAVERRGASMPDFFDWRAHSASFDAMAAWINTSFIIYGAGDPSMVNAEVVDGPYFELLGVQPILGRVLTDGDHRPDAAPVAVINERLWQERFGRSPDVLGRALQLDARVVSVVGVVPATFRGRSDQAEVWTPAWTSLPQSVLTERGNRSFPVLARLKASVALDAAQSEMNVISARLERAHPATNEKRGAEVAPLAGEVFQNIRPAISILFGAVALVLLIACANVASLLLARSETRRREMSLRRAIGAENRQLVRLLLIESAILVVIGGCAGWLVAQWTQSALLALSPVQLPSFVAPSTDWRTALFFAAIAVVTTLAIGLTPMGGLQGESLAQSLREGALASRGGGRVATLRMIVVGEVAIAVALLVGAALLGRSFSALLQFDPGFNTHNLVALRVQLPIPPAASDGQPAAAVGSVLPMIEQLGAIPGIENVSLTSSVPLSDASAIFYAAEGQAEVDASNRPRAYVHRVTPAHFDTLGLRLVEGRTFVSSEMGVDSTAVIVSRKVAERFWPGQSALGRRIKRGAASSSAPWLTIVGVADEANLRGIPQNPTPDPDLYFPFNERARTFAILLRTQVEPGAVVGAARAALRRIEPSVATYNVQSLDTLIATQLAPARFLSWLTGTFAMVALTLAIVGLYGVLSYWVRRRTAEIGIRAALGADRTQLLSLVVRQAITMAAAGVMIGMLLAAALTRFIQATLFAVTATDWVSFASTAGLMLLAAVVASVAPAVRALRLNPVVALRTGAG